MLRMKAFGTYLLMSLLAMLACARISQAQCGVILDDNCGSLFGSRSTQFFEWDFDGDGPLEPELLMGSDDGRVFAYNGSRWRQVGRSIPSGNYSSHAPSQFLSFRGELYVINSGPRSNETGSMFRWTGAEWIRVPTSGNACGTGSIFGFLLRGVVWENKIVVFGNELSCGARRPLAITWDGARWASLGPDFPYDGQTRIVGGAFVTSDGRLLIGGILNINGGRAVVAEYVNGQWVTRLSGSSPSSVIDVTRFQEIDGQVFALSSDVQVNLETPSDIGVLREDPVTRQWSAWVRASDLNATEMVGGQLVKHGETWYLAARVNGGGTIHKRHQSSAVWSLCQTQGGQSDRLRAAHIFRGELLVAGDQTNFGNCSGPSSVFKLRLETDTVFRRILHHFSIHSVFASLHKAQDTVFGLIHQPRTQSSQVYIPEYTAIPGLACELTGGLYARIEGDRWAADRELLNGAILSMTQYRGETIAFGTFSQSGNRVLSPGIARRVNGQWESFSNGFPAFPNSGTVHFGELLATISTLVDTQVLRLEGEAWISDLPRVPFPNAKIVSAGDHLFAYTWNGTNVARLDGAAWTMIPPPAGAIDTAQVVNGSLVVTLFTASTQPVLRLDGDTWIPLGVFPSIVTVKSIAEHQQRLYAGLEYSMTAQLAPLMVLQGDSWQKAIQTEPSTPLGYEHPAVIYAMQSDGEVLHLVGSLTYVGKRFVNKWAKFYAGPPRFTETGIAAQEVVGGESAYFSVEPEVYHDSNQTYQWKRDGVALTDGYTASGSRVLNARTPYLRIDHASPEDAGSYHVEITNQCGQVASSATTLTVSPAPFCPADFDRSGGVDGADVEAFFTAWELGDSLADVNQDSGIDGSDIESFMILWENGGC